jgi:hypothetical protein
MLKSLGRGEDEKGPGPSRQHDRAGAQPPPPASSATSPRFRSSSNGSPTSPTLKPAGLIRSMSRTYRLRRPARHRRACAPSVAPTSSPGARTWSGGNSPPLASAASSRRSPSCSIISASTTPYPAIRSTASSVRWLTAMKARPRRSLRHSTEATGGAARRYAQGSARPRDASYSAPSR